MTTLPHDPPSAPSVSERMMFYTVGDRLVPFSALRANIELDTRTTLASALFAGDHQRMSAYPMSVTAYACIDYRAQTLAGIPCAVKDAAGEEVDWHPLGGVLRDLPTLLWDVEAALCIWGKAYVRKLYNAAGYPTGLQWLNNARVEEQQDLYRQVVTGYWLDGVELLPPSQIIALRTFNPDPYAADGISALEVALRRIYTESNLLTFAEQFFRNAARPDGMLIAKGQMSQSEIDTARQQWREFKGSGNAWKTFVSGGEWEWVPITPPPADLAMTELTTTIRRDICIAFRVNPALIGAGDVADSLSASSTFDGIERNHLEAVTLPRMNYVLGEMNRQWTWKDFDPADHYTLVPDIAQVALLSNTTGERVATAETMSNRLADYDESRRVIGLPPRGGDYLKRSAAEPLALWAAGGITLNRLRQLVGETAIPSAGEVINLAGTLLPAAKLMDIAVANAERLIAPPAPAFPSPFGLNAPPSPMTLPSEAETEARADEWTDTGLCVALSLADNPDLIALQARLRALYPRDVEWNAPSQFHITLVYAPSVADDEAVRLLAALRALSLPELVLNVGSLAGFDTVGRHALHFRIRQNADLFDLQDAIYGLCEGVPTSQHSDPAAYTPHITMGYSTIKPARVTFTGKVKVKPRGLIVWHGDKVLWRSEDEPQAGEALSMPTTRATMDASPLATTICLALADHQMIRYAQRVLADQLADAGITGERYTESSAWSLPLLNIDAPTPGAAAGLLITLNPDEWAAVEVRTGAYTLAEDGAVLLEVAPTPALDSVVERLRTLVEADGCSCEPISPRVRLATGVPSGTVLDSSAMPAGGYPIIARTLALHYGSRQLGTWTLRRATPDMLKELRHWRSKVEKRGAGIGFETYALAGHPLDAQIRACLAHGVTPVRVFDAAMRALVDGDVEPLDDLTPSPEAYTAWWKSYDDLQHNLGAAWLDMMGRAFDALPDTFNEEYDPLRLLTKMQKPLIESWIGTPDEPGDLTKLILAGMAAGNTALKRESAARPSKRALTLTPDWELLSTQALAFAQVYGYTLIRGINATTAAQVQQIIADWIMTGESVEALRALLLPVFKNPHRAELIAQTESIRVFNEGAFERWRGVGVTQATWQTVNDAHVCPICQPLHGTVGSVDTGWTHPGGADDAARFAGKTYTASAHPGCRCFRRPKLDSIGAD